MLPVDARKLEAAKSFVVETCSMTLSKNLKQPGSYLRKVGGLAP